MAAFEIAVMLPLLFVIAYYGYLIKALDNKIFSYQGILKGMFIILNFWLILIPVVLAVELVDINEPTEGDYEVLTDIILIIYRVIIFLNVFLTAWFLVVIIFGSIQSATGQKSE